MIFSNLVTRYIILKEEEFFENICNKIDTIHDKYCNSSKNILEDKIIEIRKLKFDNLSLWSEKEILAFINSDTFNFLINFSKDPNSGIFSFLNNINIKATFNDKIMIYKLLPYLKQESILLEINELSDNKYVYENKEQFIDCLGSIRAIRNMICHHNSLSYNLMHETRNVLIKNRYRDKKGELKFSKTNLGRILIFFNMKSIGGYNAYYSNYFKKIIDLYDPLNIDNVNTKDDISKYALFWNVKLN